MDYRYENKGLHAHVHVPYRGKINISFDGGMCNYILVESRPNPSITNCTYMRT